MLAKNVISELNQSIKANKLNFKFAVFENLDRTVKASLNRNIIKVNRMTNNKNSLKALVKAIDIHRNVRAKMLHKIENAVTVKNMHSFEIGTTEVNNLPAIVAYTTDNAVIVACEINGKKNSWKAFCSDLRMQKIKDTEQFVQMYTGEFIEIIESIEFPTEQKLDVVNSKMEDLMKRVAELERKNAELSKENSVLRKERRGEKLSFDDEIVIVKIDISEPTKTMDKSTIEDEAIELVESTLFSSNAL
ncbi:TPA: hypothetical protein N7N17_002972 [Escherichia coli]|nr:hypothetical protein [Escherichia coli]HCO2053673.1 hypothetical protein [Escherichia coli]HCO2063405.1 hypothetical protein [Escherichia coli]HCO2069251.1 hypothetical protein [Escherichia coli]